MPIHEKRYFRVNSYVRCQLCSIKIGVRYLYKRAYYLDMKGERVAFDEDCYEKILKIKPNNRYRFFKNRRTTARY